MGCTEIESLSIEQHMKIIGKQFCVGVYDTTHLFHHVTQSQKDKTRAKCNIYSILPSALCYISIEKTQTQILD